MMNEMKIKEEQTRSETKKKEEATRKREEATRIETKKEKETSNQLKLITNELKLLKSQFVVPIAAVKEEKKVTKVFNPRTCTKRTCTRIVTETFGSGKFKKQCRRCIILA